MTPSVYPVRPGCTSPRWATPCVRPALLASIVQARGRLQSTRAVPALLARILQWEVLRALRVLPTLRLHLVALQPQNVSAMPARRVLLVARVLFASPESSRLWQDLRRVATAIQASCLPPAVIQRTGVLLNAPQAILDLREGRVTCAQRKRLNWKLATPRARRA